MKKLHTLARFFPPFCAISPCGWIDNFVWESFHFARDWFDVSLSADSDANFSDRIPFFGWKSWRLQMILYKLDLALKNASKNICTSAPSVRPSSICIIGKLW
ncbi:unnamed protein product [Calypogeia fissa]